MRSNRTLEQWRTIFSEQKTSGLTVIDYCREQQISTSSFYMFRQKLNIVSNSFVQAKITQQVEVITHQHPIELTLNKAKLILPSTTSASYLGQLLRELV